MLQIAIRAQFRRLISVPKSMVPEFRGPTGQCPLPRQPVAKDQARRRRDLRPRSVRLRHKPRTRRRTHTGYEGVTNRNGVTQWCERIPMPNELRDRITNAFQKRVANPLMRRLPIQTLLETTGGSRVKPGARRWAAAASATSSGSSRSSATSRSTSRTSRPIPTSACG